MFKILNISNNHKYLQYIISHTPDARAYIKGGREYPNINGKVEFFQVSDGVLVLSEINGLPKIKSDNDFFGFHIHSGSDCSGNDFEDFSNAGSHYNPTKMPHPYHTGDLPVLMSNQGFAFSLFLSDKFSVKEILNKTILIHDNPDDFRTDPSGNSGKKIACGKIIARL